MTRPAPQRRDRRRTVLALAFLAGLLPACTSSPPPNPVVRIGAARIHGPLTTDGTRIVDATGATVRFIGVDMGGMGKGDGLTGAEAKAETGCPGWQVPPASAYRNIDDWGFNTVRISLSWANIQPDQPVMSGDTVTDPLWNTAYLDALDQVVRGFTDRGIAVILHMSQSHWSPAFGNLETRKGSLKCAGVGMPDWLYEGITTDETVARRSFFANERHQQELYADAWRFVAARYASNDLVVGADLMNEPYTKNKLTLDELNLQGLYQTLGAAVREANPSILLVFQDSQYSGPDGTFALSEPPPFPGVVYTFHYYPDHGWTDGGPQLQTYMDRAKAWNVPLWVAEFDAFTYASPRPTDPTWRSDLIRMMNVTEQGDVSWTEFTYADRWMLQPGTEEPKPDLLATLKTGVQAGSQST